MSIRQWHWGKIVILWAWGAVLAAALLAQFVAEPVGNAPGLSALSLGLSFLILLLLSAVTWRWLGGKERRNGGSADAPE